MKKVSVIIPVHNNEKYIRECIDSVIHQTYKNIEIIVIDDKSSDKSLSIIESIHDKRIIVIEKKKNVGAALARNEGINRASGDYICFLDSDDYWVKDKIEKQVDFIEKNHYSFIYSSYLYLRGNKTHKARVPSKLNYYSALKNTSIFTSTVMFNMKYLSKEDIMMPNVLRGQDTATWWKILRKGITAYGMNEVLSIYRVGEKSLSSNKLIALKRTWNLYKLENLNFFRRCYCFLCYIWNAIWRRVL